MTDKVQILAISSLLKMELLVPKYQRPYKWKEKNVIQLLEDISDSFFANRKSYRLGTVILHNDKETNRLNIVDGQQRLVTISIVLYFLKFTPSILKEKFPHVTSKNNVKHNFNKIKNWFENWDDNNKERYKNYILNNCEVVKIELEDLSEAFQLFDSQNARGKALEPYDLLKAFHLREMNDDSATDRLQCVKHWEKAVDDGTLTILGKYIYRIRKWAKGENAGSFSKDDIDEFKGINITKYKSYPYLNSFLLNDAIIKSLSMNPIHQYLNPDISFPFQITQLIINGKRFFEFVTKYSEMYHALFKNEKSNFHSFYHKHCLYDGSYRTGDTYVREMYEAALMHYSDRFGEIEHEKANEILYKWCYILRLRQSVVRYSSIDKYIRDDKQQIFKIVSQSYHPAKLLRVKPIVPQNIEKHIEQVKNIFQHTIN